MSEAPSLVWFRQDLRLDDHPALHEAARGGRPVIPIYIQADGEDGKWSPGAASRWWLHQSLAALDRTLRTRGSRLVIRQGPTVETMAKLAKQTGAEAAFWHRRYEPAATERDTAVERRLRADGLDVRVLNGSLLYEPSEICTKQWRPFQVFTPFWRACMARGEPSRPLPAPSRLSAPKRWPKSAALSSLGLEPRIDWAGGLRAAWRPGEEGASERLDRFIERAIASYADDRDRPDLEGTSRLSAHLHFGEVSPRRVWHEVRQRLASARRGRTDDGPEAFLRQVVWREFAYHLLHHFPHTPEDPLREKFAGFPWLDDGEALRDWQRGRTGYPLVDAGMRELWTTGWMHNRVRMVVASFLVKHLLLPWRAGAAWFWDTLVDADLANNTLGWQWAAGCGADAAPYFRIFNPVAQGRRFDPDGAYVRRWVPELSGLTDKWVHCPWEASKAALSDGGVVLGQTYPSPIVDHGMARKRALAALASLRDTGEASSKRPRGSGT